MAKCKKCQAELNIDESVKFCPWCGAKIEAAQYAGNAGFGQSNFRNDSSQSTEKQNPDYDWQKIKADAEQKFRKTFNLDKIENFNLSEFLGQIFKRHPWSEIEEYLIVGTPSTTPQLATISTSWPAPWLFFRMIIITVLAVLLLYWKGDFLGWHNVFMPLLIFGVIGIPMATLIFFWELNMPKNISMLLLIRIMLISGFLSIAITFISHSVIGMDDSWSAIWAGPVEETAKALTMLFFLKNNRYCYKLNGLLIGAAVGTGFAFIETGGYTVMSGEEADFTMILRALLSPFCHIPWSAIVGAALWRTMQNKTWNIENLSNRRFLSLFFCSVGMHMFWNSPLLGGEMLLKTAIVGVLEYTIIIYLLQEGINEIRQLKSVA